jgi:hypothetical protein
MYFNNLYNEILLNPLKNPELNKLLVVSGYATAAMSFHYLNDLRQKSKNIEIQLIVGMALKDGLTSSNHNGFKKLVGEDFRDNFKCSYIMQNPAVHSKVYIWCTDDKPGKNDLIVHGLVLPVNTQTNKDGCFECYWLSRAQDHG